MPRPDQPEILTTDQARQGVTDHNVRRVPGWGLAGAAFALVGILIWLTGS